MESVSSFPPIKFSRHPRLACPLQTSLRAFHPPPPNLSLGASIGAPTKPVHTGGGKLSETVALPTRKIGHRQLGLGQGRERSGRTRGAIFCQKVTVRLAVPGRAWYYMFVDICGSCSTRKVVTRWLSRGNYPARGDSCWRDGGASGKLRHSLFSSSDEVLAIGKAARRAVFCAGDRIHPGEIYIQLDGEQQIERSVVDRILKEDKHV